MAAFKDAPVKYDDPYWVNLAENTEKKLDLPSGSLKSILLYGERTNADRVSSAGAKTPFQVIPQTRNSVLDKYGVDAYLSPENAAEAAGLVLKEGLQRNNNNLSAAVGEYIGGTNRKNWGKVTQSYIARVLDGISKLTMSSAEASTLAGGESIEMRVLQAYREGRLSPEQQQDLIKDINDGVFKLPEGETLDVATEGETVTESAPGIQVSYETGQQSQSFDVPKEVWDLYSSGGLTTQQMSELEADVASGLVKAPEGIKLKRSGPKTMQEMGLGEQIVEMVTGSARATPESNVLPEWTSMPELNQLSMASLKSGLGTLLTSPQETVQVIQANFPDVKVSQDAKGNYILQSSVDGRQYVIPPGFSAGDIPRAAGAIAAFTPAGRVTTLPGAALAGAGTQAIIEGTQAATGGTVSPSDIAMAGAFGAGGQALANTAGRMLRGRPAPAPQRIEPTLQATPEQQFVQAADNLVSPAAAPDQIPTVTAPQQTARAAMQEGADVGELVRKASSSAPGSSAAQIKLAEAAQVNPAARQAAERLGLDLPFDVFSDNPQVRAAVGLTRSIAGGEAEAAWVNTIRNATNRADEVVQQFDAAFVEGRPSTAVVSDKILDELKKTRQALDQNASDLYKSVDELVPKTTPVQMGNLRATLNNLKADVGEAGLSIQEKRLMKMLDEETPTYGRLIREKNQIGQALQGKDSPFSSMEAGTLKSLYAALAKDQLENVGDIAGEETRRQLRAANLLTAQKKGLENRIVSAYGKEMDGSIATKLQSAVTSAAKGDATQFNKMIKLVPEDLRKEAISTAIASASSSGRAVQGGAFGFAEYAKLYRGLRANPQVYSEIVKNLGKDADRVMRDLYEVSKRITDARAQVLTTGKANQALVEALTAESLVGTVMKSSMAQRAAGAVAGMAGPLGGAIAPDIVKFMSQGGKDRIKAAAQLFASDEFQKLAVEAATKETVSKSSIRKVAMSKPFGEFAKKIGLPKGLEAKIKWLTTAIQAGSQFGTENQ